MTTKRTPTPDELTTRFRPMTLEVDHAAIHARAATRAADGEEDDLLPVSLSSEYPVERYDWWEDERYLEILDHAPEAVDLARASSGLPFLDSHDHREQIGRILNVRVEDKKLRGDIKFSRRQDAQDVRRDMLDGIRTEVSVGYRIDRDTIERTKQEGALATVRVKRWMPFEGSSVAIPADPTVGVGRSDAPLPPHIAAAIRAAVEQVHSPTAPKAKDGTMAGDNSAPTNGAGGGTITVNGDAQAAARDVEIKEIAALAKMHAMEDKLPEWIAKGLSQKEVAREAMAIMKDRVEKGPQVRPPVELTEKEEKRYSLARAIACAADEESCFELELSQDIAKKMPISRAGQGRGFWYPTNVRLHSEDGLPVRIRENLPLRLRAGLDSKTSTTGTELKFVEAGTFIDMLRNRARVLQLGATMMSGLNGPVSFPKQTGAGTATWVAENPGSDVSESNLLLALVTLSAKTLQSTTSYSRQLLRQAVVDVDALVRADLAAIHALAIDLAAINGLGSSNQPLGILQNTSVNVVALGTNGGVPTYDSLVDLETAVEEDNADVGAAGYLTTPGIKGKLKKTQVFATTNGVPVWLGGQEGEANGYRAYSSNQVPKNLTKGTSTTICHAIIFGFWAQLLLGEWGAMELIVDPYRLKKQGMIEVTSFEMVDVAVRYAESFGVIKDALTA